MSEAATRLTLAEASGIANELLELLSPVCEQLVVCGSIRRRTQTCGDIDIVAVSRREQMTDMFGAVIGGVDLLSARLDELCGEQAITQARRSDGAVQGWGPKLKHAVFHGLKVQVQSVDAEVLGMWMLVRTGPSGYSHAFVTPRGQQAALRNREGAVVGHRPGTLPWGFEVQKGFRLYRSGGFVPTPDEAAVYKALGWRYPEPWERK